MSVAAFDLQYHAGQERQSGQDLSAYVEHAMITGRRVLGMTDHIEIYIGDSDKEGPYDKSLDGLRAYYDDVRRMDASTDEVQLLFAPELGSSFDFDTLPDEIVDLADLFICEVPVPSMDPDENTPVMIERMESIAAFRARVNTPVFFAHPFRSPINNRLVKRDIDPWVSGLDPRPPGDWSIETINRFMTFAVDRVASTAVELDLPVEINGNSHYRARGANLPAVIQLLYAAYGHMHESGVEFVPGSDQHGFMSHIGRCGGYVPWETFAAIDVDITDLTHLADLGVESQWFNR